jgi:serine protease Do
MSTSSTCPSISPFRIRCLLVTSTSLLMLLATTATAAPLKSPAPRSKAPPTVWTELDKARTRPLVEVSSLAPVVRRVDPAVLVVFTEGPMTDTLPPGHPVVGPLPPGHPSADGPPDDDNGNSMQRGQGAGFLISASGYALTNHHVIEGATRVVAYVGADKDEIICDVVGSDERSDVAVLKLRSTRTDWPFLLLADSESLSVGDLVVAIGSPFGLAQSVSSGIVSARGRRDVEPSGRQGLYDFIQTDASINPGNSGGPLIDAWGAVVGMNAAVNAAGPGIGFAIPINQVKRMLPSIIATGRYLRSWIGVSIVSVEPNVAVAMGLSSARGALIREVVPGGPAAVAGVKPGDVIVAFNERVVHEASELPLLAGDAGVDATVMLDIVRDAQPVALPLVLKSHPDNAAVPVSAAPKPPPRDPTIGIAVVTLDDDHRSRMGLEVSIAGARISTLRPGSPAFVAGLAQDDVVIMVNGNPVVAAEEFAGIVNAAPSGAILKVLVRRGAATVFAAVQKP